MRRASSFCGIRLEDAGQQVRRPWPRSCRLMTGLFISSRACGTLPSTSSGCLADGSKPNSCLKRPSKPCRTAKGPAGPSAGRSPRPLFRWPSTLDQRLPQGISVSRLGYSGGEQQMLVRRLAGANLPLVSLTVHHRPEQGLHVVVWRRGTPPRQRGSTVGNTASFCGPRSSTGW